MQETFTTSLGARLTLNISLRRDASFANLEAEARDELRSLVIACAEARDTLTR